MAFPSEQDVLLQASLMLDMKIAAKKRLFKNNDL